MERGRHQPMKNRAVGRWHRQRAGCPTAADEEIVTLSPHGCALRGACIKPTNPYYGYVNAFTKTLYSLQFMMCVAAAVASAIFPSG